MLNLTVTIVAKVDTELTFDETGIVAKSISCKATMRNKALNMCENELINWLTNEYGANVHNFLLNVDNSQDVNEGYAEHIERLGAML